MKSFRVCVADDNEESAHAICAGLKLHGIEAVAACDGNEALEICRKTDIHLALLDVCMPGMTGYEVCEALKASPDTSEIGIMFVTVRGTQADIRKGFELGAIDYITKPYNLPMVLVRVEAALSRFAMRHALDSNQVMLSDTAYTDGLTGLKNRRYLLERLHEEVEKAHRYNFPVSCVVMDLDDILPQDDELGPAPMDDLLAEFAMVVREHTRSYDILARYEGSMFVAVLPHTEIDQARNYAGKILDEVDSTIFSDPSFPTKARMYAGITCASNGVAYGPEYLMGEAMRGLLQARSRHGQRIVSRNLSEESGS